MISIVSPTTPLATTPACGARKKKSGKITRNRKMVSQSNSTRMGRAELD